jgi:UDP-N-acetylglucosamine--N-acetylmuramyl-(pentapeptide) pyrophosphoryl-undecaprenol N-acetylglucosamine transferase
MALVNKNAALIVKDAEAEEKLIPMAINTVKDMNLLRTLGKNAHDMAFRDSDIKIAEEILQLIK